MDRTKIIITAVIIAVLAGAVLAYVWLGRGNGQEEIVLSSGTPGGTYNAFAKVLADTVNDTSSTLRIRVVNSGGANENSERMSSGAADAGFIQSDTVVDRKVAIAVRLFPEVFHLIARKDSEINSVVDLKGKRVALLGKGAGSNVLFARLLEHYELSEKDVEVLHGSLHEGGQALIAGDVDALFVVIALGNKKVEEIVQASDVRLIPVDQAEAIALYDPSLRATSIPMGTYSGNKPVPSTAINIVAVDSLLAVRRGASDSAVEELTRILFEKRQNMLRRIPQAAFISEPNATHKLAFDIHEGADRFYHRDEPPFFVEYAEPMAFGMSALVLILSGVWQARSWLADNRKNRADEYNLELISLVKRVEAATCKEDLDQIRSELFGIFEKVIVDLDTDKIEEKSLQSFSFAWDVASRTVNHRQIVLENRNGEDRG